MAGSKTRTVAIAITGDATGAQKAFKDTADSSDGLGSKFGGLGPIAAAAGAAIVAGIGVVTKELFDIGEQFDGVSDKFRAMGGDSGTALSGQMKALDDIAKTTASPIADIGTALLSVQQKMGLTGKAAEPLSKQFLDLARITGSDLPTLLSSGTSAFNRWNLSAAQSSTALDTVLKTAQATGVPVTDLTTNLGKFATQLKNAGYNTNDATVLLGALGKAGIDPTKIMTGLTKATVNAAKAGQPTNVYLAKQLDLMSKSKTPANALAIAIKAFGSKAGPELATDIQSGSLSIEALKAKIAGSSDTVEKATKGTTHWSEELQILKNKALVTLQPLAEKVFGGFSTAMTFLANNALPILKTAWNDVMPVLQTTLKWIDDNKPILIGLGVAIGVALVPPILAWAAAAAAAAISTAAAALPFVLVTAAITAVVAAIIEAVEHWNDIWGLMKSVGDWIGGVFVSIWNGLSDAFFAVWHSIEAFFVALPGTLGGFFSSAASWLVHAGSGILSGLWNGITTGASDVWNFFSGLPGKVLTTIGDMGTTLFDSGKKLIGGLMNGLLDIGSDAGKIAKDIVNGIIDLINSGVIHSINSGLDTIWGDIPFTSGKFPYHIPNIHKFHTGGLVTAGPGGQTADVLALLKVGEVIRTPQQEAALAKNVAGSRTSNANNTYHITINAPTGNGADIARSVIDAMKAAKRLGMTAVAV